MSQKNKKETVNNNPVATVIPPSPATADLKKTEEVITRINKILQETNHAIRPYLHITENGIKPACAVVPMPTPNEKTS